MEIPSENERRSGDITCIVLHQSRFDHCLYLFILFFVAIKKPDLLTTS